MPNRKVARPLTGTSLTAETRQRLTTVGPEHWKASVKRVTQGLLIIFAEAAYNLRCREIDRFGHFARLTSPPLRLENPRGWYWRVFAVTHIMA